MLLKKRKSTRIVEDVSVVSGLKVTQSLTLSADVFTASVSPEGEGSWGLLMNQMCLPVAWWLWNESAAWVRSRVSGMRLSSMLAVSENITGSRQYYTIIIVSYNDPKKDDLVDIWLSKYAAKTRLLRLFPVGDKITTLSYRRSASQSDCLFGFCLLWLEKPSAEPLTIPSPFLI